jgi:hypothetical protein
LPIGYREGEDDCCEQFKQLALNVGTNESDPRLVAIIERRLGSLAGSQVSNPILPSADRVITGPHAALPTSPVRAPLFRSPHASSRARRPRFYREGTNIKIAA